MNLAAIGLATFRYVGKLEIYVDLTRFSWLVSRNMNRENIGQTVF